MRGSGAGQQFVGHTSSPAPRTPLAPIHPPTHPRVGERARTFVSTSVYVARRVGLCRLRHLPPALRGTLTNLALLAAWRCLTAPANWSGGRHSDDRAQQSGARVPLHDQLHAERNARCVHVRARASRSRPPHAAPHARRGRACHMHQLLPGNASSAVVALLFGCLAPRLTRVCVSAACPDNTSVSS